MRLLLVLTLTPLAGEPAYWSSDTIAAGSAQFAKAQGRDADRKSTRLNSSH